VIAARDSLLGDFSIEKVRAPVHAARIEQAGAPLLIPEEDQIPAQNLHIGWPMREL
jgi:hypothetical protein